MTSLEKFVDALCRMAVAEDSGAVAQAKTDIREIIKEDSCRDVSQIDEAEPLIRRILFELGSPDHLSGHQHVVRAIQLVMDDAYYLNNTTYGLYPQLALEFDTTAQRIERTIRHLVNVTFALGDINSINKYFGSTYSNEKGKATNGEFIARIANVVKMQMKNNT